MVNEGRGGVDEPEGEWEGVVLVSPNPMDVPLWYRLLFDSSFRRLIAVEIGCRAATAARPLRLPSAERGTDESKLHLWLFKKLTGSRQHPPRAARLRDVSTAMSSLLARHKVSASMEVEASGDLLSWRGLKRRSYRGYASDVRRLRQQVLPHPSLQLELERLWKATAKAADWVTKASYCHLCVLMELCFLRVGCSRVTSAAAIVTSCCHYAYLQLLEAEWAVDSGGKKHMSKVQFVSFMFSVVTLWVETVSLLECYWFLTSVNSLVIDGSSGQLKQLIQIPDADATAAQAQARQQVREGHSVGELLTTNEARFLSGGTWVAPPRPPVLPASAVRGHVVLRLLRGLQPSTTFSPQNEAQLPQQQQQMQKPQQFVASGLAATVSQPQPQAKPAASAGRRMAALLEQSERRGEAGMLEQVMLQRLRRRRRLGLG